MGTENQAKKTGIALTQATVDGLSFEEALAELEGIVQKLERGQLELDASIQAYERGTLLRQLCAQKLREAELRVEKLSLDRAGEPKLEPLDKP